MNDASREVAPTHEGPEPWHSHILGPVFRRKRRDDPFFRTEVHLREGGQGYDVMGWRKDELIHDVLDQYQRHMHFLSVVR